MPEQRGVRAVDEVDAEIDELYANAPDAFTKKRDELAKRLRAEGKSDAAASVKALRKPTQIAFVLNQVARRFADEVGELVDVGRELARAQRKALRGGDASGDLRTAIGRQRDVIRNLTTKTGELMREIGVSATGHLDEIAGALQAALIDPIVGAQLEEGRLDKVPAPATGFPGTASPVDAEPEPEPARERKIPPPPKSAPRKKTAREKQADAREAKRVKEEEARAAKALALAEKQRAALEKARGEWDKAKAQAELLATQAEAERMRAEKLRDEARKAAAEAKRLEKEATAAESAATKTEREAKVAEREAKRLATKARVG